jgi:hypothetical protein
VSSTLFGITATIDLGNAMVGLGGFALAWATWRSTTAANKAVRENIRLQANQKISDFRTEWSDKLRNDIAQLLSLIHIKPDSMNNLNDKESFLSLAEVKHRIMLRLQTEKHKFLIAAINNVLFVARNGSDSELMRAIEVVHIESEKILEEAWNRASNPLNEQANQT